MATATNRPHHVPFERTLSRLSRLSSPTSGPDRPPSLQWQQSVARSLSPPPPLPPQPPEPPPPKPSPLVWMKRVLGHVGLMALLAVYTAVGGAVFVVLESPNELEQQMAVRDLANEAWNNASANIMSAVMANPQCGENTEGWEERVRRRLFEELEIYRHTVYTLTDTGYYFGNVSVDLESCKSQCKWRFRDATFFSATLITTIGYGNMAPVTTPGRAFCIAYSLVGIPITLIVIADIGKLLAKLLKVVYKSAKLRIKMHLRRSRHGETSDDVDGADDVATVSKTSTSVKVVGALFLLLLYIALGSACFIIWEEDWTLFDSFYFSFITMTTIGLGDIVPEDQTFMMLCMVYILAGLAMTSTVLEIVRSEYEKSWQRMMEASKRLQLQNLTDALKRIGEQMEDQGDVKETDFDLLQKLKQAFGADIGPRRPPPIVYYETTV